jgi:hypothetical protein
VVIRGLRDLAGTNDNAAPEAGRSPVSYDLVLEKFEDGGYNTAVRFMAPITLTFRDIPAGQAIEIVEGSSAYKVLALPKR